VFTEVLEALPSTLLASHILTQRSFIEDFSYFYMWTSLVVPFLQGLALKCFMYFSSVYRLYALLSLYGHLSTQVNSQITHIKVWVFTTPACFGTYVPSSGNFVHQIKIS